MTDLLITDFIDIVGIREEEKNGYLTIRFENPISGRKYFFRIAKELWDVAYKNRTLIETPIILKAEEQQYNDDDVI